MIYTIQVKDQAIDDIQNAIDYYNTKAYGLGSEFEEEVNEYINVLKTTPLFRIRYGYVRCLPLKRFPFMIHYVVDELHCHVDIYAIAHTSQDPRTWPLH